MKHNNKSEADLIKKARIAALLLGYRSLREYEFAMYRKAVEQVNGKMNGKPAARPAA